MPPFTPPARHPGARPRRPSPRRGRRPSPPGGARHDRRPLRRVRGPGRRRARPTPTRRPTTAKAQNTAARRPRAPTRSTSPTAPTSTRAARRRRPRAQPQRPDDEERRLPRGARSPTPTPPTPPRPTRHSDRRRRRRRAAPAETEPKLSTCRSARPARRLPTDRYNMFNACYGLQSTRTGRWLSGGTVPTFAAASLDAGEPAVLQAHGARAATCSTARPAPTSTAGRRGAGYAAAPGRDGDWIGHDAASGQFRFEIPGKGSLTDAASAATLTQHRHAAAAAACAAAAPPSPRSAPTSRATRSPA